MLALWLLRTTTLESPQIFLSHPMLFTTAVSSALYSKHIQNLIPSIVSVAAVLIWVTIICPLDYCHRLPTDPSASTSVPSPSSQHETEWVVLSKWSQIMPLLCFPPIHGTWRAMHDPSPYLPYFISYPSPPHFLHSSPSGSLLLVSLWGTMLPPFKSAFPSSVNASSPEIWVVVPSTLSDFTRTWLSHRGHLWLFSTNFPPTPTEPFPFCFLFCFLS